MTNIQRDSSNHMARGRQLMVTALQVVKLQKGCFVKYFLQQKGRVMVQHVGGAREEWDLINQTCRFLVSSTAHAGFVGSMRLSSCC